MKKSKSNLSEILQSLPDAELEILACLMKKEEATVRDVREAIETYRPMSHGAAVSLFNRLEAKGLVSKRKGSEGKAFLYRPAEKDMAFYPSILEKMLNRVFGGSSLQLVQTLFATKAPTANEVEALQHLLDELKKQNQPKRK